MRLAVGLELELVALLIAMAAGTFALLAWVALFLGFLVVWLFLFLLSS